jgi:cell division protein FtsQ
MTARRKRRSRPSLRARLRRFWLVGAVGLVAVAWGGWRLVTLPALRMESLAITGLERVARSDVLARAHLDATTNVWLWNRAAIARRIEALPYVETARVVVRPLANVWIEIAERRPVACLREAGGRAYTLDRAARVLADGCGAGLTLAYVLRANLRPSLGEFLHDRELATLQRDGETLSAAGDHFRTLSHDAFGQLDATLPDGILVRFGADTDLDRKQRLIEPILAELGSRAGNVGTVDLRAPTAPIVVYRR